MRRRRKAQKGDSPEHASGTRCQPYDGFLQNDRKLSQKVRQQMDNIKSTNFNSARPRAQPPITQHFPIGSSRYSKINEINRNKIQIQTISTVVAIETFHGKRCCVAKHVQHNGAVFFVLNVSPFINIHCCAAWLSNFADIKLYHSFLISRFSLKLGDVRVLFVAI